MTRILSLFVMFMLFGVVAFSQNRLVTGTVTDDKGVPVEGATITVQGTRQSTAADQNGNFRLPNVAPSAVLVVSSVGITQKTVNIGTTGTNFPVSVTRSSATTELNVVTVGALGLRTSKRSQGTVSSTVNAATLTNGRPVNVAQGLSGKVSGLTINNSSAAVNASPRIVIRGLRSITGDNTALIVLDGVQVPASTINILNPNDIERIDVLKGGQSSTLFGSEGINGAIVITTKKGGNRRPEITVMNTVNVESLAFLPRTQHEFGSGSAYGASNDENFHPAENQQYGPHYDGSLRYLGRQTANGSQLLLPYSDIPDIRKRVWDKGYTRQTDLSYRGGDAVSSYFLSYQNLNSNGIVPGDKYERNVLRFNAGRTFNKASVTFDASYTFDNSRRTNIDYYFLALNSASWVPFDRFKDWKNDYFSMPNNYYNDYYNNPYWEKDNNRLNTRNYSFNGNIKTDLKLTSDLTVTGRVAVVQTNFTTTTPSNTYTYSAFAKTNAFVNGYNNDYDIFLTGRGRNIAKTPIVGSLGESQGTRSRITFDAFGVYDHKFSKVSVRALLGMQAYVIRQKNIATSTSSLLIPGLFNLNNSGSGLYNASNTEFQRRKIGGYADLSLGFFKDLIFVHGSARQDYTSVFSGPNIGFTDPTFTTYGADVSFIASDLIPSIKSKENKYVDFIKLAAAYNVNGNDNLNEYQLQTLYPFNTGFPYNGLIGSTVGNTAVALGLEPEKVKSSELSAEVAMFKNRLTLQGAIYRQDCDKQIFTVATSAATGSPFYLLNAGELRNKGYEFEAKVVAFQSKNLQVNLSGNYSHNENEIIKLNGETGLTNFEYQAPDERASLNATVGQMFPYLKTTAFQRDAEGRVIIDENDGWPKRADGRVNQGTTLPKHNLGLGFSVRLKNITMAANAEFRGGALVYHDLGTDLAFSGVSEVTAIYNRQEFVWPNSVTVDGSGKSTPNTNIAVANYKAIYQGFGDIGFSRGLSGIGEAFVSSADFWKLRDISLTYDFPEQLFSTGKIFKAASFTVFGRNLFTILPKDNWYTDPEFANVSGNTTGAVANATGINTSFNTPPVRQLGGTLRLVF